MSFTLPALPYAIDALEPFISARTLEFHHGKHHQTYVTNTNSLIKKADGGIFNNAAQVFNHTFYFGQFSATPATEPSGKLKIAIESTFGSLGVFIEAFNKAAVTQFGSGWAWLVKDVAGKLSIVQTSNAGCPVRDGSTPLLTCDVWEHAYYLDKQNMRPAYVADFWKVLDWKVVEARF